MQVLYSYACETVKCESIHFDLKVYTFFLTLAAVSPAMAADFLETYSFSSILHTDVATVCPNRAIYTDFVKAISSFCSSKFYQLLSLHYVILKQRSARVSVSTIFLVLVSVSKIHIFLVSVSVSNICE